MIASRGSTDPMRERTHLNGVGSNDSVFTGIPRKMCSPRTALGWREKTNRFFRHSLQIGTPISIANIAMIQGPDAWLDLYSLKLLAVTAVMYAKVGHMRPRVQQGMVTSDNIPLSPC